MLISNTLEIGFLDKEKNLIVFCLNKTNFSTSKFHNFKKWKHDRPTLISKASWIKLIEMRSQATHDAPRVVRARVLVSSLCTFEGLGFCLQKIHLFRKNKAETSDESDCVFRGDSCFSSLRYRRRFNSERIERNSCRKIQESHQQGILRHYPTVTS